MRLSPHEPLIFHFANYVALAHYHMGHYEEAAKFARMGIAMRPNQMLYRTLAAAYGQLGRVEEARSAVAQLRSLLPKDSERQWEIANPYLDPAHRTHFNDGLRKAGWLG
jgi:hypothetical protein